MYPKPGNPQKVCDSSFNLGWHLCQDPNTICANTSRLLCRSQISRVVTVVGICLKGHARRIFLYLQKPACYYGLARRQTDTAFSAPWSLQHPSSTWQGTSRNVRGIRQNVPSLGRSHLEWKCVWQPGCLFCSLSFPSVDRICHEPRILGNCIPLRRGVQDAVLGGVTGARMKLLFFPSLHVASRQQC